MSKDIENEQNEIEKKVDEQVEETTEVQEDVEVMPTSEEVLAQEKDKFLRLFAEFENYKKRTSKERIELFKTANKEVMTAILPILDDLNRGIVEIKKVKEKDLLKGMELISNKLMAILNQKGLIKMDAKNGDTFDAEIHEAITQIPAPSKKMIGKIIDIVEVGYQLGDTIIRFPKVVVGK